MATTKKTAAKAAQEETKAEVTAEAAAEAPAKKTAAKKTTTAKKAAPKKVAPKKPAAAKVNFFVEYGGVQVSVDDVVNNIKTVLGKEPKEVSVYLKPQESKAYFVADGEELDMDVYFC